MVELGAESEILDYFMDNGRDYINCGIGEYQDEVFVNVHAEGNFYKVHIRAEVGKMRMEYGDDAYFVEDIKSVTYIKTEEPEKPKEKVVYILIDVNYDEGETTKTEHTNVESLRELFDGDEDVLGELLNEGVFMWEWGVWHLINLGDYE